MTSCQAARIPVGARSTRSTAREPATLRTLRRRAGNLIGDERGNERNENGALERGENVRFSIVPHFRGDEAAPFEIEVWAESDSGVIVPHQSIRSPGLPEAQVPSAPGSPR